MPLANDGLLKLPIISYDSQPNSHLFYIITKDRKTRDQLMDHLKKDGIHSVFHYLPLHLSPVGRSLGYTEGQFPVTESLSDRLLRLPFYYDLSLAEQTEIIEATRKFFSPNQ
jgi:dTDP-4-amino-4,6-dideoxygalactose transaminase